MVVKDDYFTRFRTDYNIREEKISKLMDIVKIIQNKSEK